MKWVDEVPTTSKESPSAEQDRAPNGVQTPSKAAQTTEPHPVFAQTNQYHIIRKRESMANLREEYQLGTPSSKGCNPC